MKFRSCLTICLVICYGLFLSSPAFAQSAKTVSDSEAVKDLRKALTKHSRYQIEDIILWFQPFEFDSCEVSYQYKRPASIGGENFGNAYLDRTSPLRVLIDSSRATSPARNPVTVSGGAVTSNGNPVFSFREAVFFNSNMTTLLDLGKLNPEAVSIEKTSAGTHILFRALNDENIIRKNAAGNLVAPFQTNSDSLPVISEKKAEKVKELFIQAIKQCQS